MNEKKWDGKSKGSVVGYKIFLNAIRFLGVPTAYFILRFVTYYYYLFASENRKSIQDFYRNALRIPENRINQLTRTNFYYFGQTLVDRVAFLTGRDGLFSYTFENEQYLLDMKNEGNGAILLSGHIGNWETAGNLLKHRVSSKMNVLMLDEERKKIKQYVDGSTGGSHFNIIAIKDDLSHIIKIHQALSRNEFIAIHADRFIEGAKYIELDFLGKPAKFPLGPFIIASKFKVPTAFVFGIKEKKYHYLLTGSEVVKKGLKPEEIASKFVSELEKKAILHPEQWFNYYNFYK